LHAIRLSQNFERSGDIEKEESWRDDYEDWDSVGLAAV
jgi:hypothetical protein